MWRLENGLSTGGTKRAGTHWKHPRYDCFNWDDLYDQLTVTGFSDIDKVENARDGSRWSEVKDQNARAPILTGTGLAVSAVGAVGLIAGRASGLRKPTARADREARARLMTLASGHF